MKAEYNLCRENWIRVLGKEGNIQEKSLPETLLHAHEYRSLAGETAAQDMAVLRLLLAVLYSVFSRMNEKGRAAPIMTQNAAAERWKALRDGGRFPEEPIRKYLARWEDRFWLFHEERPFWQTAAAAGGTQYGASKLNGELLESSNKTRLFSLREGRGKESLSYAEAARWLLCMNGFDDTSAKPKQKNLPSPGAGWLGKLGLISAEGETLFETLLLNLTFLKNGTALWSEEALPVWEQDRPRTEERCEIPLPDDPAALLTLQSRRLLLDRKDDRVTGFYLLGGDFFPKEYAVTEQMTAWRLVPGKKNRPGILQPKRHDASRQMWQDFGSLFCDTQGVKPGVVCWNETLAEKYGMRGLVRFRVTGVHYGDKDFFVDDMFTDVLDFQRGLLSEMGAAWRGRIAEEVSRCHELAQAVGGFARSLDRAAGGKGENAVAEQARTRFYGMVDLPFREWLREVDPSTKRGEAEAYLQYWQDTVRKLAMQLADSMVEQAGSRAYAGRIRKEKTESGEQEILYSAPKAYEDFRWRVRKIYTVKGMK